MLTKLINGATAFTELESEWDALVSKGMTNTPFQILAYQKAWWQHLNPPNSTLHTVIVRDDNEELIAIACFYLIDGVLYLNGCVEETDYLDMIVSAENAEIAWTAVYDCLCNQVSLAWHAFDLCNIPAHSPTRSILKNLAQHQGFLFQEDIYEVCPVIDLADTFEGYLANLVKKQRHEIRRKIRRATGAGATVRQMTAEDDLSQAIDDFLALLEQSTQEKRAWLNNGRRAVFHDIAQATQAAGTLQLLFIEVEEQKVAALFNFDYDGRIWVYNSGLNPTNFSNLSLGVVLTAKAIEMAIENGRTTFDFLRGNETYKYRFGAKDTTIYRLQLKKQ